MIVDRSYSGKNGNIWKRIIKEGYETIDTADLKQAISSLKLLIKKTNSNVKAGVDGSVKALNDLLAENEDLSLLLKNQATVAAYEGLAHVYSKRKIDSKWMDDVPVLYLNGTGDKVMSDAIFGEDRFDITKEIRVKYNPNVTVYQLQNKSFSLNQIDKTVDDGTQPTKQEIFDLISYFYHYKGACFVSYSSVVREFLTENPDCDPKRFMYFGDTRGKKDFEKNNLIIVIGRHRIPHQALATKGKILIGCDDIDDGATNETRSIELNDDTHDAEIGNWLFTDPRMRLLDRYYNEGEVLQAIHRLRLIHGTDHKVVLYLSNQVLEGLRVDKFLIADDIILSDIRKKLVNAVQAHGSIEGKPRLIAEASGLTSKQASNLKSTAWYEDNPFFYIDEEKRLIDRFR